MRRFVSTKGAGLAIAAAVVLVSGVAAAAIDIYTNAPPIVGESTATGFTKQIETVGWTYAVSTPPGSTTPAFDDIVITKLGDSSSPMLFKALVSGETLSTVTFSFVKSGGTGTPAAYQTVTLTDAKVTSIRQTAAGGGAQPTEQVSLSFGAIDFSYKPQNADGSFGAAITAGWNLVTNMLQ